MKPEIRLLNAELQKIAEQELNETPERLEASLESLKAWLLKTPHLQPRQDDQFLVAFLRSCKFNLERAKEKLDTFYTLRAAIPEFFAEREISDEMLSYIRSGHMFPLSNLADPGSPCVLMVRVNHDPSKYSLVNIFKWQSMLQDILTMEDDNLVISGFTFLLDMHGMTLKQIQDFTPTFIKKFITVYQEGNPFRLKGFDYIRMPDFFVAFVKVVKSFLPEKIRSRVSVAMINHWKCRKFLPCRYLCMEKAMNRCLKEFLRRCGQLSMVEKRELLKK